MISTSFTKTLSSLPLAIEKVNSLNLLNLKAGNHGSMARFTKGGFKISQHKVYEGLDWKAENCIVLGVS
jgi:hypothetical protein